MRHVSQLYAQVTCTNFQSTVAVKFDLNQNYTVQKEWNKHSIFEYSFYSSWTLRTDFVSTNVSKSFGAVARCNDSNLKYARLSRQVFSLFKIPLLILNL